MTNRSTEKKELTNAVVCGLFDIQIIYLPVGIIKYIIYHVKDSKVNKDTQWEKDLYNDRETYFEGIMSL